MWFQISLYVYIELLVCAFGLLFILEESTPENRWHWQVMWPLSSRCPPSPPYPSWLCTGLWRSHPHWTGHPLPLRSLLDCRHFPWRCRLERSDFPAKACCPHRCCCGSRKRQVIKLTFHFATLPNPTLMKLNFSLNNKFCKLKGGTPQTIYPYGHKAELQLVEWSL